MYSAVNKLSQYIYFYDKHYFIHLLLVYKIVESLNVSLKLFYEMTYSDEMTYFVLNSFMTEADIIKKPVHLFALQISRLVSV